MPNDKSKPTQEALEHAGSPSPVADPMPDAMLEARKRAAAYLEKWPGASDYTCPICRSNDWGISNTGLLPMRPGADPATSTFLEATQAYPLVPISCKTCGYTYFINEVWVRASGTPERWIPDEPPETAT